MNIIKFCEAYLYAQYYYMKVYVWIDPVEPRKSFIIASTMHIANEQDLTISTLYITVYGRDKK